MPVIIFTLHCLQYLVLLVCGPDHGPGCQLPLQIPFRQGELKDDARPRPLGLIPVLYYN